MNQYVVTTPSLSTDKALAALTRMASTGEQVMLMAHQVAVGTGCALDVAHDFLTELCISDVATEVKLVYHVSCWDYSGAPFAILPAETFAVPEECPHCNTTITNPRELTFDRGVILSGPMRFVAYGAPWTPPSGPRFPLGHLCITSNANDALEALGKEPLIYIRRHTKGDWGDVDAADGAANNHALSNGGRLFSAYTLPDGQRLYVITEADRSATTILLSSDY